MLANRVTEPGGVRPVNAGQRRLLELGASLADIAGAAGGVSRTAASNWRSGRKVPARPQRERLHAALGIPPAAWDLAPDALDQGQGEALDGLEADAAGELGGLSDTRLRELSEHARRQRLAPGVSEASAVKWAAIEVRALEALDRRQGEVDRIFEPGGYGDKLLEALARLAFRHPLAVVDLARAASDFDGGRVPAVSEVDELAAAWRTAHPALWAAAERANAALVEAIGDAKRREH